jgi:pimeloyl-ACP methyl ester carboxylesterase
MKAYLIPGNGEDLESRNYQAVLNAYKRLGYEPHFVTVNWKYRTIDDWIEHVSSKIPRPEIQKSLLSGFSFGSMIALDVAAKTNPRKLHLYSLSPYFKEDRPFPAKYLKWHGKRRIENFRNFSMNKLVAYINCPTTLFIGNKEIEKYPDTMGRRTDKAHAAIKNSKLVVVEGAGHDVGNLSYVKAIEKALNT